MTAHKLLTIEAAQAQARQWKAQNLQTVFTNGCFDLLHPGHIDYLEKTRQLGDRLVLGLNTDDSVRRLKGRPRPFNPEWARARVLAGLEAVDAVVFFAEDTPLSLIQALEPDILAKGGDYRPETIVGADFVYSKGGRVEVIPFLEGYSTTALVQRIQNTKDNI